MKSMIMSLLFVGAMTAQAETATVTVNGMHCAGCKEAMTKNVCGNEAIAKTAESCEVKLVTDKKHVGQIHIVTKPGMKVDMDAVKTQIAANGEDYKVSKIEVIDTAGGPSATDDKTPGILTTTETTVKTTTHNQVTGKKSTDVKKTKTVVKTSAQTAGTAPAVMPAETK